MDTDKVTDQETPPPATQLRDRSWGLVYRAGLDFSPKFIGLTDAFNGFPRAVDGLVRTPMGYYRLAEDTRDGTRVLLHSYDREQLTGIEKDGRVALAENATDVYGITARSNVRGAIFRDDMMKDIRVLERILQRDLNLHAEETLVPSEDIGQSPRRLIKLANGHVAFGIMEGRDGTWSVRLYNNLRKDWDKTSRFAEVGVESGEIGVDSLLNPGNELKTFDRIDDAVLYVQKFWKAESTRLFRGEDPLAENLNLNELEKLRNKLFSSALHARDSKVWRDWRRAIGVGATVGIITTVELGMPLVSVLLAVTTGFSWSAVSKSIETALGVYEKSKTATGDKAEQDALLPDLEKNVIGNYLLKSEANERRFRKKLDPETVGHLRLLNGKDADMNYDDGAVAPPTDRMRDYDRLASAAFRYFGAAFDPSYDEDGVLICLYPNGLISLVQIEKATGVTRHYLTYSKDFDISGDGGRSMHLDSKLSLLPAEGEVHKITHVKGMDFRYTPMTRQEFVADIAATIGPQAKNYKAFGLPLASLFNCQSFQNAAPKAKHAIPIEDWQAKPAPLKIVAG